MQQTPNQYWSRAYDQGRDFILASSQEITKFTKHLDSSAPRTALDVGCGTGQLTRELYHRQFDVVGVDVSESAIRIAHSLTFVPWQQLTYVHINIEDDDVSHLPHQPYGLITCRLVYAFIKNKPAFLKKVAGLLDSKGIFVVITPLVESLPQAKKYIGATRAELDLLESKFVRLDFYEDKNLAYFVGRKK